MTNKEKIMAILRDSYGNLAWVDIAAEIDAIYNPPPAPTRDHNSLAVTENTPKGTLVVARNNNGEPYIRVLSHVEGLYAHCFANGYFSKVTDTWKVSNVERYIGQHIIPWDAEQSDGKPPCEGRVAVFDVKGRSTTDYAGQFTWDAANSSTITGYLPITDTGEIDLERVPR